MELDLSGNLLTCISGLDALGHLQKLVLASNRICNVDGLQLLQKLEHLLLQANAISTVDSINLRQLSTLPRLSTLYLRNVDGSEVSLQECGVSNAAWS